jgi:hypothetical protein
MPRHVARKRERCHSILRESVIQFLANPQKSGVWSLTLQPTSESARAVDKLLNLDDENMRFYRSRFIARDDDESANAPATIVPRLFAYLRYIVARQRKGQANPRSIEDRDSFKYRRVLRRQDMVYSRYWRDLNNEPTQLSPAKKKALAAAALFYGNKFGDCRLQPVPERLSALDVFSTRDRQYFQAQQDTDGRIVVYALAEDDCVLVKKLFDLLPVAKYESELRKVFSPEAQLLSMYMPLLKLAARQNIFRDTSVLGAISQTLGEVQESRFVHAIRAVGIGAEELIVEIFETYLRDKAPETPLGNLLAALNSGIQEVQGKAASRPKRNAPFDDLKRKLGEHLSNEKQKTSANTEVCGLFEAVLHDILPTINQLSSRIAELEEVAIKPQKTLVFPTRVNRSLSELIPLRNKVSHRVDRLGSTGSVTYLEAALALKSYIVLALWWQEERRRIDYRAEMKAAIGQAIERNKADSKDY